MRSRYSDPDMWRAAADQAVSVAAKATLGMVGTNAIDLTQLNWPAILNVAAAAALVSVLHSIATAPAHNGEHGPLP